MSLYPENFLRSAASLVLPSQRSYPSKAIHHVDDVAPIIAVFLIYPTFPCILTPAPFLRLETEVGAVPKRNVKG
jgi:hypothetical protein